MLRFVADENFNNNIVRGLLRRQPELDLVRIQDVGLIADAVKLGNINFICRVSGNGKHLYWNI